MAASPENPWQRIEALFYEALEHAPAAREAFLASACGSDIDLEALIHESRQVDQGPEL